MSLFDFFAIFVDLLNLVFFQNLVLGYYLKYKDQRTKDVKYIVDRQMLLSAFPLLNGSRIIMPVNIWINFIEIGRIAIFSLFKTSNLVFGTVFIAYNIAVIFFITWKCLIEHKYYARVKFPIFCLTLIFESIFFMLLGIYSLDVRRFREIEGYNNVLIIMLVIWIILSIIATFLIIFMSEHKSLFNKDWKKYSEVKSEESISVRTRRGFKF